MRLRSGLLLYLALLLSSPTIHAATLAGAPGSRPGLLAAVSTTSTPFSRKDTDGDGIRDRDDACPNEPGPAATKGCPDGDADGVADHLDNCPATAGTEALSGCPDQDRDGIADANDRCPTKAGKRIFQGCPDTDGDGIADPDDKCPRERGREDTAGCPDGDGDGIIDSRDQCPGEYGPKRFQGCPDDDGDGLPNEMDRCPTLPGNLLSGCPDADDDGHNDAEDACPDTPGPLNGCPDTDGDGVADKDDACPRKAGSAESGGCPGSQHRPVDATLTRRVQDLAATIKFNLGTADLQEEGAQSLGLIADLLRQYPDYHLLIESHTDAVAGEARSAEITKLRAEACQNLLLKMGIPLSRLRAVGLGSSEPLGNNFTVDGRARNRRIELELYRP